MSVLVATSLIAGCGSDEEKQEPAKKAATNATQTQATAQGTTPARTTGGSGAGGLTRCVKAVKPKPKPQREQNLPEPTLKLDEDKVYEAVMDTSCGRFTITLDSERAPKTAASFVYLARKGFYDNLTFHRIVPGFVIQGGDPEGTGQGGPGYSVVEAPPSDLKYTKGVVAMAKTEIEDPGTSGSQFYVVTGPDAQLPPDYALAGKVTGGMAAVDRIAVVPTNQTSQDPGQRDRPLSPVVIRSVTITERKR
jgi:cyclophilin family peptidyl-prolyl cis-trans isomerase